MSPIDFINFKSSFATHFLSNECFQVTGNNFFIYFQNITYFQNLNATIKQKFPIKHPKISLSIFFTHKS